MKVFVDTNVLVYAYDRAAGSKHVRARELVEDLWNAGRGTLSKARPPVSPEDARALVADYLAWDPIVNDGAAVLEAVDAAHRHRLSFWDALVVVAAAKSGAAVIYSEDLNHGQRYGSVQVLNPFLETES